MGLRINTNIASMHGQETLRRNRLSSEKNSQIGASGYRINSAGDDAAGLSISEYTRGKNVSLGQAMRNANDGISVVQVAEGGFNEISNILIRLKELSIQAASDTIGDTERGFLNVEVQEMMKEIDKIAAATEFNSRKLMGTGMGAWDVQIGTENGTDSRFSWKDLYASTSELGIAGINLSSTQSAQSSITPIENAITKVVEQRALVGGMQSRLSSVIRNGQVSNENQKACISRIKDADVAKVSADMTRDSILTNANISILAQSNNNGAKAVQLLQQM